MTGVALAAIGVTLVGMLLGLDRLAGKVVKPLPLPVDRTVPELGIEYEDLTIRSGDRDLSAWLLRPPQAQPFEPLVLLAHGWGANYGTVLRLAEPLADAGHDVLLFDVRGHGRNERVPYVTIRHFRDDLMAVARYAARRFPDRQLVLIGHSLGGAAGVLAAAEGAPIDGLVLIATPSDIMRITAEFLTDKGYPGRLIVVGLRPFLWRRMRSSFRSFTPDRRIRELDLPILMIQPEHDERVSRDHADRLAEAAGIEYHLIADHDHIDVLSAVETVSLIEDFLEEV